IIGGENRNFVTRVGSFPSITAAQRQTSSDIPAPGLYGDPINSARVTSPVAARSSATIEEDDPALAVRAANLAQAVPRAGSDVQAIPHVVVSYFALWVSQLKQLGTAAGTDISTPPITGFPG